jgi:hypothetical protein
LGQIRGVIGAGATKGVTMWTGEEIPDFFKASAV